MKHPVRALLVLLGLADPDSPQSTGRPRADTTAEQQIQATLAVAGAVRELAQVQNKLADAVLLLAAPSLKERVESLGQHTDEALEAFRDNYQAEDTKLSDRLDEQVERLAELTCRVETTAVCPPATKLKRKGGKK